MFLDVLEGKEKGEVQNKVTLTSVFLFYSDPGVTACWKQIHTFIYLTTATCLINDLMTFMLKRPQKCN